MAFTRGIATNRTWNAACPFILRIRHPDPVLHMHHPKSQHHTCIPESSTCHPNDPVLKEPPTQRVEAPATMRFLDPEAASHLSSPSLTSLSSTDLEQPDTPATDVQSDDATAEAKEDFVVPAPTTSKRRRASTALVSQSPEDVKRILSVGTTARTERVAIGCCGEGCCLQLQKDAVTKSAPAIKQPDNDAFRSLQLRIGALSLGSDLTHTVELPETTVSFESLSGEGPSQTLGLPQHPPDFVTPHPPYYVYPAKVHHARELTKPGAEKRTYHFDLDVTDYPEESGDVDFVVGGAVGVCAPNADELVNQIFNLLNVPRFVRDKQVLLKTKSGRWPTIWGDEIARELVTTRQEILTWCSDIRSYPPTKQLFRLLAEYADAENENKILLYLSSAQGQSAFCDLRTGPHITIAQLWKHSHHRNRRYHTSYRFSTH